MHIVQECYHSLTGQLCVTCVIFLTVAAVDPMINQVIILGCQGFSSQLLAD